MSVFFKIPQTARFLSTSSTFVGTFNVPTVGVYDFGSFTAPVAVNNRQRILSLKNNTVYLIERLSLGGNIGEETYLDSINTLPTLTLGRERSDMIVYQRPLVFSQFIDNREVAAFVHSDKSDDWLVGSVYGVLNQVPATVGKTPINLYVSLSIYAMDNKAFNAAFRDRLAYTTGQAMRR